MPVAEDDPIQRWSTADVPVSRRLDLYASALAASVTPFSVGNADIESFHGILSTALFGEIRVTKASGAAHGTVRGRSELSRSSAHSFNLLVGLQAPWTAECGGRLRLVPGDVLLFDSERPIKNDVREDFSAVNVSVPETWLRRWLPDPNALTARRIQGNSLWGNALSSYLRGLTPELVAAPPLPLSVIADQVGSLLALTANAVHHGRPTPSPAVRSLHQRIDESIRQRSIEHNLTAADVAASVGVSLRTLHRTLAAANQTFGSKLIEARARTAERMLTSPLFRRVTTAEIGRRAGFLSPSHFARVIRLRTGRTPMQLRKAASTQSVERDDAP